MISLYGSASDIGSDLIAASDADGEVVISGGTYTRNFGTVAENRVSGVSSSVEGSFTLMGGASLLINPNIPGARPDFNVGTTAGYGLEATGTLNVLDGSLLEVRNNTIEDPYSGFLQGGYGNINIGSGAGGSGVANVDGAGSGLLVTEGSARLTLGENAGTGTLNITNGGFVGTFDINVGEGLFRLDTDDITSTLSVGRVLIDGAGSELRMSTAYGNYASAYQGAGGYGDFGRRPGGTAYLTIQNGGTMTVTNEDGPTDNPFLRFGRDVGSSGTATITGLNSSLNVAQVGAVDIGRYVNGALLVIGQAGLGVVKVEQDAQINVTGEGARLAIAYGRDDQSPTANQSLLEIRSGADVTVDSGTYRGASLTIGERYATAGKLMLTGSGSTLSIVSDQADQFEVDNAGDAASLDAFGANLTVGLRGRGEVSVADGAVVLIDGADDYNPFLKIGEFGQGDVTVSGSGSTILVNGTRTSDDSASGSLIVGDRDGGTGSLMILAGAAVALQGASSTSTSIGNELGSRGVILVDGAASNLTAGAVLNVGGGTSSGDGRLVVTNGASVTAGDIVVGRTGEFDLSGSATGAVAVAGRFSVAGDGIGVAEIDGSLEFTQGGILELDIDGFSTGNADLLRLVGNSEIDLRRALVSLNVNTGVDFSPGDRVTVVEATGVLNATERFVYDQNSGAEFRLAQEGNSLVLIAQEDAEVAAPRVLLVGDDTQNALVGTESRESIHALGGNDVVDGGAGSDKVDLGLGNDSADGGTGEDTLTFSSLQDPGFVFGEQVFGVFANLSTQGTAQNTGAGLDTFENFENLEGSQFGDLLTGDGAANTLTGLGGGDVLNGGDGDDVLLGGEGFDAIEGGAGADQLFGGTGGAAVEGDIATYFSATGPLVFDFGATTSEIQAGSSAEVLEDTIGADIEGVAGAGGHSNTFLGDELTGLTFFLGGSQSDSFVGGSGVDQLIGLGGDDVMYGNDGGDALIGQGGDDDLFGGTGADVFFFDGVDGNDTIHDLELGIDLIFFAGGNLVRADVTFSDTDADGNGVTDALLTYEVGNVASSVTVIDHDASVVEEQASIVFS